MSQANEIYVPSAQVSAAADALIAAIQAEIEPNAHYLILPAAMSESFLAMLRIGMQPMATDAVRWVARGSVTCLQAVAVSSDAPVALLTPLYMKAFRDWFDDSLESPPVVLEAPIKPSRDAS